jgi:hypothetical protein
VNTLGVFEWADGTNWAQIGGPAGQVYAGGGLEATNPQTGNVCNYNSTTKASSEIGGPGEKFVVAADDHFVYGLSSSRGVFSLGA